MRDLYPIRPPRERARDLDRLQALIVVLTAAALAVAWLGGNA